MKQEKITKTTKPIYISVPKLEELLRMVSQRSSIKGINSEYFTNFGSSDATLAVSSLRFLGIIDENGNGTSLLIKVQPKDEEKRKNGFKEIVEKSYKKLFDAFKEPYNLSNDQLHDAIRAEYEVSKRVANTAAPAFRKLCEYAGFIEPTASSSPRKRQRGGVQDKIRLSKESSVSPKHHNLSGLTDIEISKKVVISIAEDITKKVLLDKRLREHLDAFLEAGKKFAENIKDEDEQT